MAYVGSTPKENYVELVIKIVVTLDKGDEINAVQQNEKFSTYSLWRDEADYFIDWQKD
jgi:methionyl-tRNA formyltransferase